MGFFSNLFGGGAKKPEETDTQALQRFFKDKLPANYVNSPKYTVSITRGVEGYEARINLDMTADGSTYEDFGQDNFEELADWESELVFEKLARPPVTVSVTFDMDFGGKNIITMNRGRILAK